MTLNVTVPDAVYRQMAELAARQQVSAERIVAAALAEQMAGRASRDRFLAALDKVPAAEPAPEDRLQCSVSEMAVPLSWGASY
jgi:hypothetical protein